MPTLSPAHTSSRTWLPGDGRTNMDADTVIMTRIKGGQDSEGVDKSVREARARCATGQAATTTSYAPAAAAASMAMELRR
jgi:hypothetical protein